MQGDKIKILFEYYDRNGDGMISYHELFVYLKTLFTIGIKLEKNQVSST